MRIPVYYPVIDDFMNILEEIYKSGLKFLEPLAPDETYKTIVREATRLVGADYGSILLFQNSQLVRVYASSTLAFETIIRKEGNTYKAFKTKKPIVADISNMKLAHPELAEVGIKWSIFIPLSYKNQSIGVLTLNSKTESRFDLSRLTIMQLFGSMASLAIRKAQLHSEVKKALDTRDLFISMAAHELRTPLTTIGGYAQMLNSKLSKKNTVESKWSKAMLVEIRRLNNLVEELLEMNRIRSGKLQYKLYECDIKDVIGQVIERFNIIYPHRQINFTDSSGDRQTKVIGDSAKLLQAMGNLLNNAIKFSPTDSVITILLEANINNLIISIRDQGLGIAKKDLPKIFEGFYRGSNHNLEGIGLGLWLVKNIINRHKGSVIVQSALNKGTMIQLKLPRRKL